MINDIYIFIEYKKKLFFLSLKNDHHFHFLSQLAYHLRNFIKFAVEMVFNNGLKRGFFNGNSDGKRKEIPPADRADS